MLKNKRVFDATAQGAGAFGNLPEWDLSDLYTGEDAPELHHDLEWLKSSCKSFSNDYDAQLTLLTASVLLYVVPLSR